MIINKRLLAHVAVLTASLIYGANYTIAKAIMPSLIAPFGFILVRVVVAGTLFWLLALWPAFRQPVARKDWPRFILCGLLGSSLNQLAFFKGLSYTLPIHASLMLLTIPICVTILAALLIHERITWLKVAGLACGISGALLLIGMPEQNNYANATNIVLGDALVLFNAFSFACYLVIAKPLMRIYHPIVVVRYMFTFGFFFVLPFGFKEFSQVSWEAFQLPDWLALGYVAVFTTFLAYILMNVPLKILAATTVGAYIYLQPVFAAIISMIFFGETLTWTKVISAVLIFAGVYLVSYIPKQQSVKEKV